MWYFLCWVVDSGVMDAESGLLTYNFWMLAAPHREALKTQMVEMEIGSLNPAIVQRPLDATPAQLVIALGQDGFAVGATRSTSHGMKVSGHRKKERSLRRGGSTWPLGGQACAFAWRASKNLEISRKNQEVMSCSWRHP